MFYRFFYNYSGSFVLLTAIILPMLIIVLISAINISEIYQAKTTLQNSIDNALITAVAGIVKKEYLSGDKVSLIRNIKNHMENSLSSYFSRQDTLNIINGINVYISYNINKNSHLIKISSTHKMRISILGYFLKNYGNYNITISANGAMIMKKDEKHASSIVMVLDISASMKNKINIGDDKTKLQIAKESINLLVKKFKQSPSEHLNKYLRLGYVAFSTKVDHIFNLQWGLDGFMDSINNLSAKGNTNSAPAMLAARDMLLSPMETYEYRSKGSYKYKKYVIFMTDGYNFVQGRLTRNEMNKETITYCNDIKKAGGEIYVIAISLDIRRSHKACASSPTHLFNPKDEGDIRNAFSSISSYISKGSYISKRQILLTK